jgi:hypothetical protein
MWDKETFSPKNLGAYSDLLGGWKGLGSLRGVGEAVLSDARAWLLILGGILGGIGLSVGRLRWLLGSVFAVVGVLSYLALFALVPERVYLPVLFFPLFLACVLSAKGEPRGPAGGGRRVLAALFIIGCLAMAWFAGMKWSGLNRFFHQEVAYLRQNPERLNLVWGSAFPYELGRCWADERLLDGLKIFQMSYLQRTSLANEILVREGLRNPLRDMVDQDDSVLICLPSQGALAPVYLKERFDMEARGARVYKGPLFYVYRLVLDRNVSKNNPRP